VKKRAVFLTAYDRPHYFVETLRSWNAARIPKGWDMFVVLEPSPEEGRHFDIFDAENNTFYPIEVNERIHGVLENPYVWFSKLFKEYDYVVRAEDDLLVSDDVLEFHDWAATRYQGDPEIGAVTAFTHEDGHPEQVRRSTKFSPWVWGTWRDRWEDLIEPSWDHDYSTYNGSPGNESGWDWNLDTRVFPQNKKLTMVPKASRVQNIGSFGVHARPEFFETTGSFLQYRGISDYYE